MGHNWCVPPQLNSHFYHSTHTHSTTGKPHPCPTLTCTQADHAWPVPASSLIYAGLPHPTPPFTYMLVMSCGPWPILFPHPAQSTMTHVQVTPGRPCPAQPSHTHTYKKKCQVEPRPNLTHPCIRHTISSPQIHIYAGHIEQTLSQNKPHMHVSWSWPVGKRQV